MPEYFNINSRKEFLKFNKRFAKNYGAYTNFLRTDLNSLVMFILNYDVKILNNYVISKWVNELFAEQNEVYTNDPNANTSYVGKINSIYMIKQSIKNNQKFYSPISLSVLSNGLKKIHPGATRLMLADVYPWPVDIVATTYPRADFPKTFQKINFSDLNVDFFNGSSAIFYGYTDDPEMNKSFRLPEISPPVMTKQIMDHRSDAHKFHQPQTVDPPRIITFDGESIFVDSDRVCRKINDEWTVNFD